MFQDYFFVLLLACILAASVVSPTVAGDGSLTLCESETDDIIYNKRHHKKYALHTGLVSKEEIQLYFEGMTITCINAVNEWNDGTGGTASLRAGGLGRSNATIFLQGQPLRGYSFEVVVRGEPAAPVPTTSSSPCHTCNDIDELISFPTTD